MARPKQIIEQPINLSADVQVIVRAPKNKLPHISWEGGTVTVSVEASPRKSAKPRAVLSPEVAEIVGVTTGPDHDTDDIKRLKEELAKKHPGGASRPYTSNDAFRDAGFKVDAGELTNVFEAAAAEPPPVFSPADLGGDN